MWRERTTVGHTWPAKHSARGCVCSWELAPGSCVELMAWAVFVAWSSQSGSSLLYDVGASNPSASAGQVGRHGFGGRG